MLFNETKDFENFLFYFLQSSILTNFLFIARVREFIFQTSQHSCLFIFMWNRYKKML